ncbi:MAG: carboxypeptidase-like regulatory domain-containing protein, partial [Burkholderiaceae bacterium]
CKASLFVCAALASSASLAATPPNTSITNTATASYSVTGTPVSVNGQVTITTAARTPSVIEFLQFVPPGAQQAGTIEAVPTTQCSTSGSAAGPFVPSSGPVPLGSTTPFAIPGNYPLAPTNFYHGGEAVFVKLTDLDQNLNPNVAETVITTIRSANGDSETLRLTETGPSTGVFIGYIQSTFGPVVFNDCRLSVAINTGINATYTDIVDGSDSTIDGALVDPFGLVFDSTNGNAINGATVTLIDLATGAPAQVLCDDGVTPYPSSVISGSSFAACGTTITLPAGSYRFPLAAPGTYRLQIAAPANFSFPSTVETTTLQALSGAPFSIVAGSRGETFVLNPGPALQIDV